MLFPVLGEQVGLYCDHLHAVGPVKQWEWWRDKCFKVGGLGLLLAFQAGINVLYLGRLETLHTAALWIGCRGHMVCRSRAARMSCSIPVKRNQPLCGENFPDFPRELSMSIWRCEARRALSCPRLPKLSVQWHVVRSESCPEKTARPWHEDVSPGMYSSSVWLRLRFGCRAIIRDETSARHPEKLCRNMADRGDEKERSLVWKLSSENTTSPWERLWKRRTEEGPEPRLVGHHWMNWWRWRSSPAHLLSNVYILNYF